MVFHLCTSNYPAFFVFLSKIRNPLNFIRKERNTRLKNKNKLYRASLWIFFFGLPLLYIGSSRQTFFQKELINFIKIKHFKRVGMKYSLTLVNNFSTSGGILEPGTGEPNQTEPKKPVRFGS